jgi:hypothetical protein
LYGGQSGIGLNGFDGLAQRIEINAIDLLSGANVPHFILLFW